MFLLREAPDRPVASSSPFREVRNEEELWALAGQWNELHAQTACPSPFTSWEWAWAWWRHFGRGACDAGDQRAAPVRRLRVVTVHDCDGLLLAVAPFYYSSPHSPLLSHELRLFGDDGRDGEGMTDEPILLLRSGREHEATQMLMQCLLSERRHDDWDYLKVRFPQPTPADADGAAVYFAGSAPPFFQVRQEEGPQTVALPETWAAFRQTLSRSMRDNLAYYPRRLTRDGHAWRVEMVREPDRISGAVDILVCLHNRRARSGRGVSHLSHLPGERQAAFLKECLPRLAACGMAMVGLLQVDGQTVAAQAFLEAGDGTARGREMVMYYSGFCPDWYGYSPVMLIGAAAIQDAADRGVKWLNFLPGPFPWKERWGTRQRGVIEDVRCLRPRPQALARVFCRSAHRRWSALWPR